MKVPARIQTLKYIYDFAGISWFSTRDAKLYMNKSKLYYLRDNGLLEKNLGAYGYNSRLKNYNDSFVHCEDNTEANGNFWRITIKGFDELEKYYNIDNPASEIAKLVLVR